MHTSLIYLFICCIGWACGAVTFTATPIQYSFHGFGNTTSYQLGTKVTVLTNITAHGGSVAPQSIGVCARDVVHNWNYDFPKFSYVSLNPYRVVAPTQVLTAGVYTVFACVEYLNVWYNIGTFKNITVPVPTSPSSPSGMHIPTTNPDGFTAVFSDDFSGNALGSGWYTPYWNDNIPSAPGGIWRPSHVVVTGNTLQLRAYKDVNNQWTTGGLMATYSQTYGKYEIRMKMEQGNGIKYVSLLWPTSPATWYSGGEIDFTEDGGGNRSGTTATVIWFPPGTQSEYKLQKPLSLDLTTWHTMGVEWTSTKLTYTIDGIEFGSALAGEQGTVIPSGNMSFVVQTEPLLGSIDSTTPANVTLFVDWVRFYKKN